MLYELWRKVQGVPEKTMGPKYPDTGVYVNVLCISI